MRACECICLYVCACVSHTVVNIDDAVYGEEMFAFGTNLLVQNPDISRPSVAAEDHCKLADAHTETCTQENTQSNV